MKKQPGSPEDKFAGLADNTLDCLTQDISLSTSDDSNLVYSFHCAPRHTPFRS